MIDMEQILYEKVKSIMSTWTEPDIYAVSFFVYANEEYTYGEFDNVSEFLLSYNAESDCPGAGKRSEERWNYAYWRQDTTPIISPWEPTPETKLLFDWYREQGIEDVGREDDDCPHGPVGYYELLMLAAKVARRLQEEGFLKEKFGRPIPILVHGLEYYDDIFEATRLANPHAEAEDFLSEKWDAPEDAKGVFDAVFGNIFAEDPGSTFGFIFGDLFPDDE